MLVLKLILLYKQIHIIDKINKLTKNISLILFTITNIKFHLRIQTYYIFCQFYAPEILVGVFQILSSPFLDETLKNCFNWSTCSSSVSKNFNKISDYLNEPFFFQRFFAYKMVFIFFLISIYNWSSFLHGLHFPIYLF